MDFALVRNKTMRDNPNDESDNDGHQAIFELDSNERNVLVVGCLEKSTHTHIEWSDRSSCVIEWNPNPNLNLNPCPNLMQNAVHNHTDGRQISILFITRNQQSFAFIIAILVRLTLSPFAFRLANFHRFFAALLYCGTLLPNGYLNIYYKTFEGVIFTFLFSRDHSHSSRLDSYAWINQASVLLNTVMFIQIHWNIFLHPFIRFASFRSLSLSLILFSFSL